MKTTTAIVATKPTGLPQDNWSLETIEIPDEPGDNEALVEIVASGICHTDLLLSKAPPGFLGVQYPKILGHEGAGYVRAIGRNITTAQAGDPVLLSFDSCRSCSQCTEDHPAYCHDFVSKNCVGRVGSVRMQASGEAVWDRFFGQSSFSRFSIISEASIINVKDLIPSEDELKLFAPLGCGFQTGVGAILNTAMANEGDSVMIIGVGGVGLAAIMAAKVQGCKAIVAVDRLSKRLELAKELGATQIVNTSSPDFNPAEDLGKAVPGGPSIVIDTSGDPILIENGLNAVRRRGKLVLIGSPPFDYELNLSVFQQIHTGKSVIGCTEGDSVPEKTLKLMIKWYREGQFPIEKIISFFPMSKYSDALTRMHEGSAIKPVLIWMESKS